MLEGAKKLRAWFSNFAFRSSSMRFCLDGLNHEFTNALFPGAAFPGLPFQSVIRPGHTEPDRAEAAVDECVSSNKEKTVKPETHLSTAAIGAQHAGYTTGKSIWHSYFQKEKCKILPEILATLATAVG